MDYSFIILIISIFIARFIQLSAFKNLADADKPKVLSRNIMQLSQTSLVFTIILIVAFYFLINKYPERYLTLTSSFFIALIVLRLIVFIFTRKRMIENEVPSSYLTRYFLSWLVTTIGVALFIVLFMHEYTISK